MTDLAPNLGTPDRQGGITRQAAAYRNAVQNHVEPGQPVCILGFPDHNNSGDAAIYLGEVALFDTLGCRLDYVCSKDNYNMDVAEHYPDGPIFLHGGGNFGDLYGENNLRLRALAHYRGRKIVQLPQTIHFQKPEGVEKMARAIADHGDVHLMLRDIPSYDFAKARFDCTVTLVPDAAYYLQQIAPSRRPRHDVLSVQRTDKERASDLMSAHLRTIGPVRDWRGKTAPWSHFAWVAKRHIRTRFTDYLAREARDMRFREASYRKRAQQRLDIAVDVLSAARVIVSDRLHAHIISSLLRKRHVALDNSYGKISSYVHTWGNDGLAILAQDLGALRSGVEQHLADAQVPEALGEGWNYR